MKRAYLSPIVDLSLPIADDPVAARRLGAGLELWLGLLEAKPSLRLEVALAASVTLQLLRWGEERALQLLAERAGAGQVSFLTTAAAGALLPLVPPREATRQLTRNDRLNREALGEWVFRPEGLFPPQLGYSRSVAELASDRGLPRILADGLALGRRGVLPRDRHFVLSGRPGFHVFFVDRELSWELERGHLADAQALHRLVAPRRSGYALVRIPGRTLAERGPATVLLSSLSGRSPTLTATLEEILALFPEVEPVEPIACALGTDPGELAAGVQFAKWSAPGNELHALLWRLVELGSAEAARLTGEPVGGRMHAVLDESLDCSAWRFASGKPELDPPRVLAGGRRLLDALRAGGDAVRPEVREEAEELFARLRRRCEVLSGQPQAVASPPPPA
ncbi:MAG: hypothetical protein HY901_35895 [Deltaproteobacteria bacterium]|nr:hypothetical protein [Deltaproteobacteria bacterium]